MSDSINFEAELAYLVDMRAERVRIAPDIWGRAVEWGAAQHDSCSTSYRPGVGAASFRVGATDFEIGADLAPGSISGEFSRPPKPTDAREMRIADELVDTWREMLEEDGEDVKP
jgi:hypothetical protein